jgi:lipopolysaccharide/colanic/teichoic acid biosynthesis glycosyltransferase
LAVSEHSSLDEAVMQRLLQLRAQGIQICSLVNWAERCLQRVPPELLSNRWLLQAEGFAIQPGRLGWRVKRLGDVVGSAFLLLLSSPVLVAAGALIWLEDRGPVLYSQVRTGLYGRPFRIWKLRTMRVDAEAHGVQWACRSDPRITRIGGLLRVLRIDELPQLVGVLNGDLSLIGPRPERPEIEEQLEQAIPHYRIRHWIRPGLSGWAQVCHPYGASLADSRMKLSYDLYYLRNAGLLLDALITLKTIRLVSGARGAVPSADPEPAQPG